MSFSATEHKLRFCYSWRESEDYIYFVACQRFWLITVEEQLFKNIIDFIHQQLNSILSTLFNPLAFKLRLLCIIVNICLDKDYP